MESNRDKEQRNRGGGRRENNHNHYNNNNQRPFTIQIRSDMWYAVFVHKLLYDEIPKSFKGLKFARQDKQLVIEGPRANQAKRFILDYLQDHYMIILRYQIWNKINLLDTNYLNLKREYYFEVIGHKDFIKILELIKNEFGEQPTKFIKEKLLNNRTEGFTVVMCSRKQTEELQIKINDLCGMKNRQQNTKNNQKNVHPLDKKQNKQPQLQTEQRRKKQFQPNRRQREHENYGDRRRQQNKQIRGQQYQQKQRQQQRDKQILQRKQRQNDRDRQKQTHKQNPPEKEKQQYRQRQYEQRQQRRQRQNTEKTQNMENNRQSNRRDYNRRQPDRRQLERRTNRDTNEYQDDRQEINVRNLTRNQSLQSFTSASSGVNQSQMNRHTQTRQAVDFRRKPKQRRYDQEKRKENRPIDNNRQFSLDLTDKQLFLALTLQQSLNILRSKQFIAYVEMDNLVIRGQVNKCQKIVPDINRIIEKWSLLVFHLKYSIDEKILEQAIPKQSLLRVISSKQMQRKANIIKRQFQTDKYHNIIRSYKSKGEYIILVFLKQYFQQIQEALYQQVIQKLQKQHQKQTQCIGLDQLSQLSSIYKIDKHDFDQNDFLNFSMELNIDQNQLSIVSEKEVIITPSLNMSNFTRQGLDRYFKSQKFIFLGLEQEQFGSNFMRSMEKKYPRLSLSLQTMYSQYCIEDIKQDRFEYTQYQIHNDKVNQNEDRRFKIFYIAISGINNHCSQIIQHFEQQRRKQMQKRNIIQTTWKIKIPQLIKYNLMRDSVRNLIQNFITKTIKDYQNYDFKIKRNKPEKEFKFLVVHKKDAFDVDHFQSQFENLIESKLNKHFIKQFTTISDIFNIEGMENVGIFAEDEGQLYLISLTSLQKQIEQLNNLIKKEIIVYRLSLYQTNYYNIIRQLLEKAKIKQNIDFKESAEQNKKIIELKGYKFRVRRLNIAIQKVVDDAKKSLDFDVMYISRKDKDVLQANQIIQKIKNLDILITTEESKEKIIYIDFSNNNRIIITTCDIDKYHIVPKIVHEIEQMDENSLKKSQTTIYDSQRAMMYINYKNVKSCSQYIQTLYDQLSNNRSQWLEFKMSNPNYQLNLFLNKLIVYLGSNEDKQHIHFCITKNDKKIWEDIFKQLKNSSFKTTKEKNEIKWKYSDGLKYNFFNSNVSQRLQKHFQNLYSNSKLQLTDEDIGLKQRYTVITERKQIQRPSNSLFSVFSRKKTQIIQEKYIENISTKRRYKIQSNSYVILNTYGKRILSNHIRNLLSSNSNQVQFGLFDVNKQLKVIQDVLTNKTYELSRVQNIIQVDSNIQYQIVETPSFFELKFQSDKSKYAYIMGAKHQIKQKIKDSKMCQHAFSIKNTSSSFDKNQYSSYYSSYNKNNSCNIFQLKKVVEKNLGIMEFSKKGSWKTQKQVIVFTQSKQQIQSIINNIQKKEGIQKTFSNVLQLISTTSFEAKNIIIKFPFAIKMIYKIFNSSLEKLYNQNKLSYRSFRCVERQLFFSNHKNNLQDICLKTQVSFDSIENSNVYQNYITLYEQAQQCHATFQNSFPNNKRIMLYCRVLTGIPGTQTNSGSQKIIHISKSNFIVPLFLIQY